MASQPQRKPVQMAQANKVVKPKRERKLEVDYLGDGTLRIRFRDGSGAVIVAPHTYSTEIRAKALQVGLARILTSGKPTLASIEAKMLLLHSGKWSERESAPKLPDPLAQALANIAIRHGQGVFGPEQYAKMCSAEFWQKRCFGPSGMTKAERNEQRAKFDVKAEIARVREQRAADKAKAEGKTFSGVDLQALAE